MVPEWNHFIHMQIDHPKWPSGAVTKNSINTLKWQYLKNYWLKLIKLCARTFSCMKPFWVFESNYFRFMHFQMDCPRWPLGPVTKKHKHENDNISETIDWNLSNFVPECFFVCSRFEFSQFGIPRWPPFAVTKIAQNMKMTISQ